MQTNLIQEIAKNKFLLILLEEKEYSNKLQEIIKSVEKTKTKICYVCLSKPYRDVVEDIRKQGLNADDFFFVDVLSSHYREQEPVDNCIFVSSPTNLVAVTDAIRKAVDEKKCSVILFDTISTLLVYQETSSIVKFTHCILTDEKQEQAKKLFIVLKGGAIPGKENTTLLKDLSMFADKTLDFK
jgi:predicted PP-loop superfamily ATPase